MISYTSTSISAPQIIELYRLYDRCNSVTWIDLPLYCYCTLHLTNLMTSLLSSRPNLSDVTVNSMSFVLVLTKISFLFTSNLTSNFIIVNQRLFDLHLFSSISSILLQCFIIKFTKTERGPHSLHMFNIKSWKF